MRQRYWISLSLLALWACSEDARPVHDGADDVAGDLAPIEAGRDGSGGGERSTDGPRADGPRSDGATACTVFPANNPWNTDISGYAVHSSSQAFINSIGATEGLHADFGTVWNGAPNGIPYVLVAANQTKYNVTFDYPSESDKGPYPIPLNAPIEGGPSGTGDRHVIAVDMTGCYLYELFNAYPQASSWKASSGAIFNLRSNALRPTCWTSADAAGLPIYPGLVRYEEVKAGAIKHALRFTVAQTQKAFIPPATHYASSSTDTSRPPMGLRLRLKASYPINTFSASNQVILTALKKYGMFVADNGSDWYISGAPSSSWSDDDLAKLSAVKGSAFDVVETGKPVTSCP